MQGNIINIYPSKLLSTETKKSRINDCKKKNEKKNNASQITKSRSNE